MFVYVCQCCGTWQLSMGVEEVFGTLYSRPGEITRQCTLCTQPMYRVQSEDRLRVLSPVEAAGQALV